MKKILLLFAIILLCFRTMAQQGEAAVQAELNSIFSNIDKSQIPYGYLAEYGSDFVAKQYYNGVLADSNMVKDMSGFRFLYTDIVSSKIYNSGVIMLPTARPAPGIVMPSLGAIDSIIATLPAENSTPLILFNARYSVMNENAVNLGLFTVSNNQLFDVPGRTQSPYIPQQAFAATPVQPVSKLNGTISLKWLSSLTLSNTSQVITQVWVNFLDGAGYQLLPLNGQVNKTYTDSSGYKKFNIKALCNDGSYLYTSSQQYVSVNPFTGGQTARFSSLSDAELAAPNYVAHSSTGAFSDGKVYIRYSQKRAGTALAGKIVQPFIVVEGYDIHDAASALQETNYNINKLIKEWNDLYTSQGYDFNGQLDDAAGYDLIFVDYYTMDDITQNARMLENVINWVNANKVNNASGIREKNVVMGISMGGLVTRFCLAQMTKESKPTEARLLLTQDSPHQGANVPLGLQHFLYDFGSMTIVGKKLGSLSDQLKQFYDLNNKAATQNQLIARVLDANGNVSFNTFLAPGGIYRQKVDFLPTDPQPAYTFKAVSQGSQCGNWVMPVGTLFAEYDDIMAKTQIVFGIITSWRYKLTASIKALPAQGASGTISYSRMQRNIRFLFGAIGTGWKTTYEYSRPAPVGIIPWDCVPGSTQSISGRNGSFGDNSYTPSINSHNTFAGNLWRLVVFPLFHVHSDFVVPYQQDLFSFVPITSSLDIANADINSFNRTHIFPVDGLAGSRTDKYVAQEKFTNIINGVPVNFYNLNHTDFTKRNSKWIFNEMQGLPNTEECAAECTSTSPVISGNPNLCAAEIYTITGLPPSSAVTWTTNPTGIVNPTPIGNGQSVSVSRITNGDVTLTATLPCNTTVSRSIHAGGYGNYQVHISGYTMVPLNYVVKFTIDETQYPNLSNYSWNWPNGWVPMSSPSGYPYVYLRAPAVAGTGDVTASFTSCGTNGVLAAHWTAWGYGGPFRVSPNPATDVVKIEQLDAVSGAPVSITGIQTIELTDKMGTVLLRKKIQKGAANSINIPVANLKTDVYNIRIFDGKEWKVNKVVVKH